MRDHHLAHEPILGAEREALPFRDREPLLTRSTPGPLNPSQAQSSTAAPAQPPAAVAAAQAAESSRNAEVPGAGPSAQPSLGVPGQESSATGLSGVTANDTSENVETGSKRSLTGRRRGASTGSKRSNRQLGGDGEKQRPGSSGRTQAGSEPRPKKRGGLLAFLTCCGGSSENQEPGSRESAQPAKLPTTASQPTRARQNQQHQEIQPPNASATNTSADGSKEVIDEKAGQQPKHNGHPTAAPILPTPPADSERHPQAVVQPENPVPSIPPGLNSVQPNPEVQPLTRERQDLQPEAPTTGPPHIDTTQRTVAHDAKPNHSNNPQIGVIAPTPIVSQQEEEVEDDIIQDRTPEQAARDTDIEMSDSGPSIPLGPNDVPQNPEVETTTRERRGSSSSSSRIDLPPPPPLAERQIQHQHGDAAVAGGAVAGTGVLAAGTGFAAQESGHDLSAVSTPEQTQKWLLPPIQPQFSGKKCLVLDLDETLVHSSFKVRLFSHPLSKIPR